MQIGLLAGIGAALPRSLLAAGASPIITKAIPSTGEKIPVMGIGTNQFGRIDYNDVRDILKRMYELGGTVIDTAALYGDSEVQIGKALAELGLTKEMFIATKYNAPHAGPTGAPPRYMFVADAMSIAVAAKHALQRFMGMSVRGGQDWSMGGQDSVDRSTQRLRKVDLLFIHQLDSVEPMMPLLQDLKKQGKVRYIGITTVSPSEHPRLAEYMRKYPMDFVQVDYSLGDRAAEKEVFPLAQERKIALMAAVPLGGGRNLLLKQVGDRQLPRWAADYDIATWGQFLLKYVVSHSAVTCAIPGSSKVSHLEDNQSAGHGRLPDAAGRRKMEAFWEGK